MNEIRFHIFVTLYFHIAVFLLGRAFFQRILNRKSNIELNSLGHLLTSGACTTSGVFGHVQLHAARVHLTVPSHYILAYIHFVYN